MKQVNSVIDGESKLQGRGLFAQKRFKAGQIVLNWNPKNKYLTREELDRLTNNDRRYVAIFNAKYLLIAKPERYMNHSCDPNTRTENGIDYALRDIKIGDEITGDYESIGTLVGFECNCQSKNCRKVVRSRSVI